MSVSAPSISTPTLDAPKGVEAHGIDLIPPSERHGTPRALFGLWAGVNLNVFYVVNGAVVISLGLSLWQAAIAILLGNIAFFAIGLSSLQGPKTGTSTFAVSRASFGPNGGRALALFNWVTCVGFEASGLALIVLAVLAVFAQMGVEATPGLKVVVILVAAAVQSVLPLIGHAAIVRVQRRLAWVSTVLFAVMAVLVAPNLKLGSLGDGHGWVPVTLAVALLVSAGGSPGPTRAVTTRGTCRRTHQSAASSGSVRSGVWCPPWCSSCSARRSPRS